MRYLLIICLFWAKTTFSQNFFTTFYGGISGYQGDLVESPLDLIQSHPAFGIGLMYELNEHFLIRGDFSYGKISGDDKYSLKNKARNLSFESNLGEFSIGLEYIPISLYNYKVSPYIFTGIAGFKFSPFTIARNGSKVSLVEIDTEGQGFYQGVSHIN